MAAPSPPDQMNWIGNVPGGQPTHYPEDRRPARPWVHPLMRVPGWGTSWGDRHVARVRELDALFRAHRILNGEGTGRIWVDFMVDMLYLARREIFDDIWAEQRGLVFTDSESQATPRD